jgi:hypothetical protein
VQPIRRRPHYNGSGSTVMRRDFRLPVDSDLSRTTDNRLQTTPGVRGHYTFPRAS